MATTKGSVTVELYDLSITERKDDRFGRVVNRKSLNEDDLIAIAVSRRTDLSPTSLRSTMEILKDIAKEQIVEGASVSFGLGYFSMSVNGVFYGDDAKWDSTKHSLSVKVTPNAALRTAVSEALVDVRGMAEVGNVINSVLDVASGDTNGKLTPGGGLQVNGSKLKIVGDNPEVGISFINQLNQEVIKVPATSILTNEPSKLIFIIPASLATGDYKICVTTQFSSASALLKEPRSYVFNYILTV